MNKGQVVGDTHTTQCFLRGNWLQWDTRHSGSRVPSQRGQGVAGSAGRVLGKAPADCGLLCAAGGLFTPPPPCFLLASPYRWAAFERPTLGRPASARCASWPAPSRAGRGRTSRGGDRAVSLRRSSVEEDEATGADGSGADGFGSRTRRGEANKEGEQRRARRQSQGV